jgi:hypothetical protein
MMEQQRPRIIIKRNLFGHFEHPDTGFIFDPNTEQVIGKHVGKGKIEQLSEEDKQKAKIQYNFVLNK